jgi:hypothetical protein
VQIRLRIKGIRSELNQMFAIGSIREDYLGYEPALTEHVASITDTRLLVFLCRISFRHCAPQPFLVLLIDKSRTTILLLKPCYKRCTTIWTSARRWRLRARESEREKNHTRRGKLCLRFSCHQSRYPIGTENVHSVC